MGLPGWGLQRDFSWVRTPKRKREPLLSPEQEQTAQHLAELGCTNEQVERHLNHLNAQREARAPKQPKPVEQREPQPRKQQRPPTFYLTQEQIDILLPKLKERDWRWSAWPRSKTQSDWVGHAVMSVPGVPDLKPFDMGYIVGDVLTQLAALGLIQRIRISVEREAPTTWPHHVFGGWRVEVVQPPRKRERLHETWADVLTPILEAARVELRNPNPDDRVKRVARRNRPRVRLEDAQSRDRAALTGKTRQRHSDIAERASAAV